MSRLGGFIRLSAFSVIVLALLGFGAYAGRVAGYGQPDSTLRADAIVVLTGDAGRLAEGGDLLREGFAAHLLISGVHPSVTTEDIQRHTGLDDALYDCCVVLGLEAADTAGNAEETADWASANGYRHLIIVTSDYHLPRSLLEMEAAMPGMTLTAYPVLTQPPWRDPSTARLWLREYAKYSTVWLAARIRGTGD